MKIRVPISESFKGEKGDKGDPGPGTQVNAAGTLANRALHDAKLAGFTYLAEDVTPKVVTTSAIRGLVNPRQGGNLTAFAKASVYEKELTGASPMQDAIPMTTAAA